MTRPRVRRRGNPRSNGMFSCSPTHDIQTAFALLQESLPDASWTSSVAKSEHPTADLLRPFFTTISIENDPNILLRIANFLHALPPSLETLPIVCHIAEKTASSSYLRDGNALSVSLCATLFLGQTIARDEGTRDAFSRALPILMPVLQTSIFNLKQSVLRFVSTTDETPGKTVPIKISVQSIRSLALRVLIYLAEMVSRPMAQYWIQLLPSCPGVANTHSTRENLATILLYDSQTEARSLSATAIISLISSSKTFIQNSCIASKQTSTAFTPSSARMLNCCRAMFSVLSSCIPKESNGVVVAKLARLTAQLFSAMPTSAMVVPSVQTLLKSLLQRALDQPETDLTARVACASALANALSSSVALLEPNFLSWIASQIVESLHPNQPVAELLVAFRAVVYVRCDLFSYGWFKIKAHLQNMSSTSEVALHTVRVFSSFLSSCLRAQQLSEKETGLYQYIPLLINVYDSLVKDSLQSSDRVLRNSAVNVVQQVFQFHSAVASSAVHCNHEMEFNALGKDAIRRLKQFIIARDEQVLAACIRTIAHAHLLVDSNFTEDTLRIIGDVMQGSANSGKQVTKFCMSSMTLIAEKLSEKFVFLITEEIVLIITKCASIAAEMIRNIPGLNAASCMKSSSERASEEATKTAAVNLITSYISVHMSICERKGNSKEFIADMSSEVQLLCQLLQNSEQTLNLRCCTCRALGRVVSAHSRSLKQCGDDILRNIMAAMSPLNEVRMQICSASSLIAIMKSSHKDMFCVAIVQSCIKCYIGVMRQLQRSGVTAKLRTQQNILLDSIGELVVIVFGKALETLVCDVEKNWNMQWEPNVLIAIVSSYLSLPKYVKYESNFDFDKVMDCTPQGQRDALKVILNLTRSLMRTVKQDVGDGASSTGT